MAVSQRNSTAAKATAAAKRTTTAAKKPPAKRSGRTNKAVAERHRAAPAGDRLDNYRGKRDFAVTSEPSGDQPTPAKGTTRRRFVVQRHRASHLHYDLRLEAGGVLLSWAVPKGPTLDPDVRRMAVHVEDHPVDYFDFEGVIPAGEYGGGDVIVWDWGTYEMADDADPIEAMNDGSLHFDVHGDKLAGRFALVRRGPAGAKEQWLLIHKHDADAVAGWDPEHHPASVKTGRTNDEVKAGPAAKPSGSGARRAAVWSGPTADELAALDALPNSGGRWTLGEHTLKLTNLAKVLFPAKRPHPAVTKRHLIRHYAMVAPHMLPYLHDRPVNLHRYPDGIDAGGFWHKARPAHAPDFVGTWRNADADPGETETYAVLGNPAALVWAANFGGIELHPWTSTSDHPHQPTWAMIDLDPGTRSSFDDIITLARLHRTALEHLGVEARPKVTGSRGIQIWIPVADGYGFADTGAWIERLSRLIGNTVPELVSWEWQKAKRGGLARLDYTQNAVNKTLVAPFSVRPRHGAPVSVPIDWDELDDPGLRPDQWRVDNIVDRLSSAGDPLASIIGKQQLLPDL